MTLRIFFLMVAATATLILLALLALYGFNHAVDFYINRGDL